MTAMQTPLAIAGARVGTRHTKAMLALTAGA